MSRSIDIFMKSGKGKDDNYETISTPSDFENLKKNIKLNDVFAGGKRKSRKSKKTSRKHTGGRKSRKSKKTSRKHTGGRKSRKSRKSKKTSKKYSGGKKSRKSRKSKKTSKKYSGGKKSRKSRKGSRGGKREMPPAAKKASEAFRGLTKHICDEMGIKFGAPALKLAGMYNNKAKTQNPNNDPVANAKAAKALFDADSVGERKKKLADAERMMAEKKAAKKANKTGGSKKRFDDDDSISSLSENGYSSSSY